jgi:hypothetical protein
MWHPLSNNKEQTDQLYQADEQFQLNAPNQETEKILNFPGFHQSPYEQHNPIQKAKQLTHPTMYGLAEPSTGKSTTPATEEEPPRSPLLACRALSRSMRYSMRTPLCGNARSSLKAAGAGPAAAEEAATARSATTATAIAIATATSGGLIGCRRSEARRRKRERFLAPRLRVRVAKFATLFALKGLGTAANSRLGVYAPLVEAPVQEHGRRLGSKV